MSNMEQFYARLIGRPEPADPYQQFLDRLTRVQVSELSALGSDPGWQEWGSPEQE